MTRELIKDYDSMTNMPKIKFRKNQSTIEVQNSANLMKSLLNAGIPVASSCNGEGICGKCVIQVLSGQENLTGKNNLELNLIEKYKPAAHCRYSCQTHVIGDITIDAGYW